VIKADLLGLIVGASRNRCAGMCGLEGHDFQS